MDQPAATHATQPIDLEHAIHGAGGVAAWTRATAEHHGLVAQTGPVDTFADAVSSRLSDAEVDGPRSNRTAPARDRERRHRRRSSGRAAARRLSAPEALMAFAPFGDHATRGYLCNVAGEIAPKRVKRFPEKDA